MSHANESAHAEAIAHFELTISVFQNMKVGARGEWKPIQEGVIIASRSIINLQEYYLIERDYKFLLTSRFSQDCLESLFSQIRRRQKIPHALMFKNVLRQISLSGKTCRPPRGHGYEYDEGEMLLSLLVNSVESSSDSNQSSASLESAHCPEITDSDVLDIIDDWELLPLYDMAGAALKKVTETHKIDRNCSCIQALSWQGASHHPFAAAVLEKNYKDGALIEVSDECFLALVKCEINFRILRSALLKESSVDSIQEIINKSLYVWENIQCPPCHGNVPTKLMQRYLGMRWKQFQQKGKKDVAEMASVYSSKSHAQKEMVRNLQMTK